MDHYSRRSGRLPPLETPDACAARDGTRLVEEAARVIDVRSQGEFQERHLPAAENIPLDRLREEIARLAPNVEQPLLLHCLSGTRSGMGKAQLKKMGYRNVFNLGSYGRAEKILGVPTGWLADGLWVALG